MLSFASGTFTKKIRKPIGYSQRIFHCQKVSPNDHLVKNCPGQNAVYDPDKIDEQ